MAKKVSGLAADPHLEGEIETLYLRYREEFIAYARKYFGLEQADAVDIFQESFIALYQNIRSGKLKKLTCSLRTYLFQIGKFNILNLRRHQNRHPRVGLTDHIGEQAENPDWAERQEWVYRAVRQLKEPCQTLLTLFYWDKLSMEEIARAMKYGNAQVAKNRKSLCIKKLRESLLDL